LTWRCIPLSCYLVVTSSGLVFLYDRNFFEHPYPVQSSACLYMYIVSLRVLSSRLRSCYVWWYLMAVPFFCVGIVVVSTFAVGLVTSCLVVSLFLSCLVLSCLVLSCLVLSAIQPASQPASQLAKQSASQPACQPACQPSNQAAVTPRCINHRMALAGACGEPELRSTCFPIEVLTFCLSKGVAF
jgi:hypothetical protein